MIITYLNFREEIQTCNLKYIVDAADNEQDPKIAQTKERIKAMKKRAKKIKTRMSSRSAEFEASLGQPNAKIIDAPNKAKIGKSIRDIDKLLGKWFDYYLKFIYSEKATKFCEIFPLFLTVCTVVKSEGKISQNFVAFSEYMNFNYFLCTIKGQ